MARPRGFGIALVLGTIAACSLVDPLDDISGGRSDEKEREDGGPTPRADSGGPDTAPATGNVAAAIAAASRVFCARLRDCSLPGFEFRFGTLDGCTAEVSALFAYKIALPGVSGSAKAFEDCATVAAQKSCAGLLAGEGLTCTTGLRTLNEKCVNDAQCESELLCATDAKTCRTCVVPPVAGAPCSANGRCGAGLVCNANNVCIVPAAVTNACDDATLPCVSGLACVGNVCNARVENLGSACNEAAGGCDNRRGLYCVNNRCEMATIKPAGASCTTTIAEPVLFCVRGAECVGTLCAAPPGLGGLCGTNGAECPFSLECVDDLCAQPKPSGFCD